MWNNLSEFNECEYPTPEEYNSFFLISHAIGGYLLIMISLLGIIANVLAICILSKKNFKSNFNNLLIALAFCDLSFLFLCIIDSVGHNFLDEHGNSDTVVGLLSQAHHYMTPKFIYPLHNILFTISIFMTVSISIERYLAVFHPLVYRNRSYTWNLFCHILPVLLVSCLVNIPKFFESRMIWTDDDLTFIEITDMRMDKNYVIIYQNWIRLVLLGLVPMLLLVILNTRVFVAINSRKSSSRDNNYSTILLLIVAIFIICHFPRVAMNIYEALEFDKISQCGPPMWSFYFNIFSGGLFPVLNSTLNFFIYFFAGKKFRNSFCALLTGRKEVSITAVVSKTSFRTGETRLNSRPIIRKKAPQENVQMIEFRKSQVDRMD